MTKREARIRARVLEELGGLDPIAWFGEFVAPDIDIADWPRDEGEILDAILVVAGRGEMETAVAEAIASRVARALCGGCE